MSLFLFLLVMCLRLDGLSIDTEEVLVMEGDSVTLNTGVQTNQQYRIRWYYNNDIMAEITGDLSYICTDVQCDEGNWKFRDRLKLDHQTGSLTIMNIRNTDSGYYKLWIDKDDSLFSSLGVKFFSVSVHRVSADTVEVSVMEGDSVTIKTGVQTIQQDRITWYYNGIRIARITGDLSYICTDVQCNEGTERFRDRLKLDHQTGSLTIMNIRNTHSGEYTLEIISDSIFSEKIFSVNVHQGLIFPDPDPDSDSDLIEIPVRMRGTYVALPVVAVLLIAVAAAVIYCCKRRARRNANRTERNNPVRNYMNRVCVTEKQIQICEMIKCLCVPASGAEDSSPDQRDTFMMKNLSNSNLNQTEPEPASETPM